MGKEGGAIMMKEYISLVGFILTIFIVGIAVGKLVEKIERFLCRKEAEEHNNTNKNDRH
jgi:Co/Zn/Cd efflux system component